MNFEKAYEKLLYHLERENFFSPDTCTLLDDLNLTHYREVNQAYTCNHFLTNITLSNLKQFQKTTTDRLTAEGLKYLLMMWGVKDENV